MFTKKYFKYKNKYLMLKKKYNLVGGELDKAILTPENLAFIQTELKKNIHNKGQHNCGIIFINNYVIKCLKQMNSDDILKFNEQDSRESLTLEKINDELEDEFVKYYKWTDDKIFNYIEISESTDVVKIYARCILMKKLDGDLTDYILKKSYLMAFKNLTDFDFYYQRLNFRKDNSINFETESEENKQKFKEIKKSVVKFIYKILLSLNLQLIFLYHGLLKKGWVYGDLKLDNIGYIKENEECEDIKLLFIDYESGLSNILDFNYNKPDYTDYLNEHFIYSYIGTYSIFGQDNLETMLGMDFSNAYPEFNKKEEIISTLTEKNFKKSAEENISFRWIKFHFSSYNNFFVIQFFMGLYRLVFFDDYSRHMSNPEYNTYFNSFRIDELYFSIKDVYDKLDEIIEDYNKL